MNFYVSEAINLSCSLLALIIGMIRLKYFDKATRIFLMLIAFNVITECAACFSAIKYNTNAAVYSICELGQVFLVAVYYNYCIKLLRKWNLGFYIGILCVLLGILDIIHVEPLETYHSYFFVFELVFIFAMSILLFRQLILLPYGYQMEFDPHFWIALVLLSFYVLNYFIMSLYENFPKNIKGYTSLDVDDAILIITAAANIGIALIFFAYPKLKSRNVVA